MVKRSKRKVFCIGFHKTGTTTMRDALEILGYRVTGPNGTRDPNLMRNLDSMVRTLSLKYDAFQDNPWPILYRKMDEMWPESRFILTVRDEDKWFSSIIRHFGSDDSPMRKLIYGDGNASPIGNEAVYKERLRTHNQEVQEYFSGRPKDFLMLDVTQDGSWEKVCSFLGDPVPSQPFPHSNSATQREWRDRLRQNWLLPGWFADRLVDLHRK